MSQNRLPIVGISPEGVSTLAHAARQRIAEAEIMFGGRRLLDMFPAFAGEKVSIGSNLEEVVSLIKTNLGQRRMVVLASGDPGLYGIAGYLAERLDKSKLEIFPSVSSMQLAFARIGESWDDAILTSVHGRPIEDIVSIVRHSRKVGIFTDDRNSPVQIARMLCQHGIDNRRAYVCQDVGTENEKIVETDLDSLKDGNFSPLNVVILITDVRQPEQDILLRPLIGIADDAFRQPTEGHLITKQEVRAVSLAKLALTENSTVWDIGAGSGAVAIEASLLAGNGTVLAVEKNGATVAVIQENIRRFGRENVKVIHATAPAKLDELPAPDAVFVGGNGGELERILQLSCRRLRAGGRIVVNAATLETLQRSTCSLNENGFDVEVALVSVARSKAILDLTRLEALNPVFVITGWRRGQRS